MAIDVKEALGQFEQIVKDNEEKDVQIEGLQSEMSELRQILAQARADNKASEPFADIINDKTPRKEYKKISINSSVVYKSLLMRARQTYGNERPLTVDAVANHALAYALSGAGWPRVVKTKIERPEDGS